MKYPSKTLQVIFESKGDRPAPSPAATYKPKQSIDVNSDLFNKVAETYFKMRKPEEQEVNHFVGTVFRTLFQDICKPIVEEFEKRKQ